MAKMGNTGGMTIPPRRDGVARTGTMQNGLMSGLNNLLPAQGSKERYDMVMQLVNSGLGAASQSNSPLANLLAPLAGAAIGGGATRKYNDATEARNSEMANSLLGSMAGNPQAQAYLTALNDPNTPPHLRAIAQSKLDALMTPPSRGGDGGYSGGPAPFTARNTDALIAQVLQAAMGAGGDGGETVTAAEQARIDLIKNARSRMGASSTAPVVDELTGLLNGGPNPPAMPAPQISDPNSDPLGILN